MTLLRALLAMCVSRVVRRARTCVEDTALIQPPLLYGFYSAACAFLVYVVAPELALGLFVSALREFGFVLPSSTGSQEQGERVVLAGEP